MNLATAETRKVDALDAWRRGALVDADAAWSELAQEYERHHFSEGLLAVRFNHLLVALESGDRPRIDGLMASLGSQLLQLGAPSPLTRDIATRICRLFAEPVPGVDHQATAALLALARDKTGIPGEAPVDADAELPAVEVLLDLHAEDAAQVLLHQALRRRPATDDPAWLIGLRQHVGASELMTAEVEDRIRDAAEAVGRDDLLHGYPALVDAFEWAIDHAPDLAAEWAVGLSDLEARGLPERLRYVPTMPQDRRQRGTVRLHARLARALALYAGGEALARRHWQLVMDQGQSWLDSSQARNARGGGRADDVLHEAEISLLVAEAQRADGHFAEARAVLSASVARARRDAFDNRALSARVMCADADLAERLGDDAATVWQLALDAALPGCNEARGMEQLARIIDRALADEQAPRAVRAAVALAGLARTGPLADAARWLRRARIVLSMLRPALSSRLSAQAALAVELSAARLGDSLAAGRALEAAQVVGDRPGIALALLYRARAALESAADKHARRRAFEAFADAAAEARLAAAGGVRRAVEAAVARAHRAFEGGDPARVNIHLRRAIEASEGAAFADGVSPWDACLPTDDGLSLAFVVDQLLDEQNITLARRLCAAGRRQTNRGAVRTAGGALADRVRAAHRQAFRADWLGEGQPPEALTLTAAAAPDGGWSVLRETETDLQIEFRVLDDVTFVFAVQDELVRGHRIDRSERDWAADVDALRSAAHTPGTRLDAVGTAIFHRLCGPIADLLRDARRLVIVPDGPLFDLPFALLRSDRGCLGEHLEIVTGIAAPAPVFGAHDEPAPAVALIIGDDATARDLRISTLSGQGFFQAVDVRHGADLGPDQLDSAIGQARIIHALGALSHDARIGLIAEEASTSLGDLASAIGRGGAVCATLMGPVEGAVGLDAVRALLPGARGGVLMRRWEIEEDGSFLLHFLAGAAHATHAWALAEALAAARRAAIRANLPPAIWAAYCLTVAVE